MRRFFRHDDNASRHCPRDPMSRLAESNPRAFRRPALHRLSRRSFLLAGGAAMAAPVMTFSDDGFSPATIRLNGWLESRFDAWLATSPMQQGYLGLKTNAASWDDLSESHQEG